MSAQVLDYPFGQYDRLAPWPQSAGLADGEPLVRVHLPFGGDAWLARRYADVKAVLTDTRFSRAATIGADGPRPSPVINHHRGLINSDPPDHTRLRRLVAKAFTPRRVEELRPRVQQIIDTLFDAMIAAGAPADLMEAISWPLPITVICEMLGVPTQDQQDFRQWTDQALALSAFEPEQIEQAWDNLRSYLADLLNQRRTNPTEDLLSALVEDRDDHDRLSEQEMVQVSTALLIAGHETTASHFGNFIYTLLHHQDQMNRLRAHPELAASAVEELMRYTPLQASAQFPAHIATQDIPLGGVLVRAGESVFVDLIAANRDPRIFDNPDDLNITRQPNPHLGLGHGIHHCLGAPLARLELQLALTTTLRRLHDLRLAVPENELAWKHGRQVRGLHALPVTWTQAQP
ncbi:cytochrome P450 105Q4 Cyp105Q4 [Mycobacteroides abscessus subsp. massiliense]|uniref:cytochrome P450 n=1 Tax=Mycobacteroides abscessus TaxID=36809 RepID=UPI0009A7D20D|nr:cytochrome P450 [Mycobacteroides abscessus]SKT85301.1 cytochrome P450 105Q4 Cyp105Q4 [Mycobacteroides abscessus subsp. massiliense]